MKTTRKITDRIWSEIAEYRGGCLAFCASATGLELLSFGFHSRQEAMAWLSEQNFKAATTDPPNWLSKVHLVPRLIAFLDQGQADDFHDVPLNWGRVSAFQRQVYESLRQVSSGQLLSYRELAIEIGKPLAARAVGSAMARNPWPIVVPCHRVVPSGRGLGGYSAPGGLITKQRLLELEGHTHFSATR